MMLQVWCTTQSKTDLNTRHRNSHSTAEPIVGFAKIVAPFWLMSVTQRL